MIPMRPATTGRGRWGLVPGAVATGLLLLASNPVALLAAPFLGGAVIWAAARARRLVALGRGLASLALGCGLSAFFWLPALAERREVHLERLLADWLRYVNHFVWPHQLVVSPWGYGHPWHGRYNAGYGHYTPRFNGGAHYYGGARVTPHYYGGQQRVGHYGGGAHYGGAHYGGHAGGGAHFSGGGHAGGGHGGGGHR